ncbi:hypothetical protein JCM6882_006907 [Rhodosporidiobolus microsporus]
MDYDDDYAALAYAQAYWSPRPKPIAPPPTSGAALHVKMGWPSLDQDRKSSRTGSKAGAGADGDGDGDSTDSDLDASTKLSKDDLALLDGLDPFGIADYLEQHSRPVDQLSLSLKLMKAVQIITNRADVEFDDGSVVLEKRAVGRLLELLGGALANAATAEAAPKRSSVYLVTSERLKEEREVKLLRARLGLPARTKQAEPVDASAAAATAATDAPIETEAPVPTPAFADLAAIFAENTKLVAAALRPEAIFDAPAPQEQESAPSMMEGVEKQADNGPVEPAEPEQPPAPCFIGRLPAEVLHSIFTLARQASVAPKAFSDPYGDGLGKHAFSAASYNPYPLEGSKSAALRFALGLSTVCKSWTAPARSVAFNHLHIHHGLGLVKLNKLLGDNDDLAKEIAPQIKSLDVLLPTAEIEDDPTVFDNFGPTPSNRRGGRRAAPRSNWRVVGGGGGSSGVGKVDDDEKRDAGEEFLKLAQKTANLQSLKLRIVPMEDGYVGGMAPYADFLETVCFKPSFSSSSLPANIVVYAAQSVFRALTSLATLRSLTLLFTVDFEELESILASMPNLETLKIDSLDNVSNSNGVVSTSPNPASRLHTVHVGNIRQPATSSLSGAQLTWLLEPSVDAGALRDLQVCLVSQFATMAGVFGGIFGGGGGAAAGAPPFAFASFADLLTRCSALERLVLYDMSLAGTKDASLGRAPHNDSLDHALSHLTSLADLSLHWEYTASSLLTSISPLTSLKKLSLFGTPTHTPSASFADALEDAFPALEAISFAGGLTGGGAVGAARGMIMGGGGQGGANGGGWTGGGIRRIKEVAERRGIKALVSRD